VLQCSNCGREIRTNQSGHYVHLNDAMTCGLEHGWATATPVAVEQEGLFDNPVPQATTEPDGGPYTRRSDPDTSSAAAATLKPAALSLLKQWILLTLRTYGPLTHEEMYDKYQADYFWPSHKEQTVRSRCNELVKDHGLVTDSGLRRKMRDGNNAVVWKLTES
jgi:hypothetical protein